VSVPETFTSVPIIAIDEKLAKNPVGNVYSVHNNLPYAETWG
jgi:hypothetical protein